MVYFLLNFQFHVFNKIRIKYKRRFRFYVTDNVVFVIKLNIEIFLCSHKHYHLFSWCTWLFIICTKINLNLFSKLRLWNVWFCWWVAEYGCFSFYCMKYLAICSIFIFFFSFLVDELNEEVKQLKLELQSEKQKGKSEKNNYKGGKCPNKGRADYH